MNWTYNKTFNRNIIFSNIPLNGYYRFESIFQINPGEKKWHSSKMFLDSRPIILEYNTSFYGKFENINDYAKHQKDIIETQERFRLLDHQRETLALLTLITNANFYTDNRYFLTNEELGDLHLIDSFIKKEGINEIIKNNKNFLKKERYMGDDITFT